jgi:hypothetical protein
MSNVLILNDYIRIEFKNFEAHCTYAVPLPGVASVACSGEARFCASQGAKGVVQECRRTRS